MAVRGGLRWGRLLGAFLAFWLLCLLYFTVTLFSSKGGGDEASAMAQRLTTCEAASQRLENENNDLRTLLRDMNEGCQKEPKGSEDSAVQKQVSRLIMGRPGLEYEQARRTAKRDANEMWWFMRASLTKLASDDAIKGNTKVETQIQKLIEDTQHRHQALVAALEHWRQKDSYDSWRQKEAQELSDLIQARLHFLQNPSDCTSARKLVCNLNKGCGYGCQIHHAVYCFIVAYGTERMLVLKSKGWRYNREGFEQVFKPLSETCRNPNLATKSTWPGRQDSRVVELGIVDSVSPRPKFLPPAIPADLADRISAIHGDPIVWWVAQFLKFMLKPQSELASMLAAAEETQGLNQGGPVVGIHVRRTDKVGTEAAFHPVDEYMQHVGEYFQGLEVLQGSPVLEKRVYVASDDPKVLKELRSKFPDYTFMGDPSVAKSAAMSTRYTANSLKGIIMDIHMLSRCEYLVCTFSSQVCRIAYQIMQQDRVDAADRFKSLDDIWYFGGQDEHQQVAVMQHQPSNKHELELKEGDVIGVAGNHWDGFNKGRNHRTNRVGLYPEYKTKEKIKIVDFPTYPEVKL